MTVGDFRCRPPVSSRVTAPLAVPPPTSIAAPAQTRSDPDSTELDTERLSLPCTRECPQTDRLQSDDG